MSGGTRSSGYDTASEAPTQTDADVSVREEDVPWMKRWSDINYKRLSP